MNPPAMPGAAARRMEPPSCALPAAAARSFSAPTDTELFPVADALVFVSSIEDPGSTGRGLGDADGEAGLTVGADAGPWPCPWV